jgi:hypothetical protein
MTCNGWGYFSILGAMPAWFIILRNLSPSYRIVTPETNFLRKKKKKKVD